MSTVEAAVYVTELDGPAKALVPAVFVAET
jgi:hypothetical protein